MSQHEEISPSAGVEEKPIMNERAGMAGLASRFGATTLAVILSLAIEHLLEGLQVRTPYLVFLPVITGACAISGIGTGLFAIALSALGLWYFFIPPGGFALPSPADFVHLCVFSTVSCFGCWIIDGLQRANDELSRDNVMLGHKIALLLRRKKPN